MKEVIIAKNAGFCFGVKRAVDIALNENKKRESKTFTLGPLIHNDDAINRLKDQDIYPVETKELNKLNSKDSVVIRSHGVTPGIKEEIKNSGVNMIDATCPYVLSIHKKVKKHYELGYQIIIVGDENHPEVIGINGWCDDTAIITKDGTDLPDLSKKVCIVAQTTQRLFNYQQVVEIVEKKCDELLTFNTICSATKERQDSADELSKQVDLMIVIGGKKSSNSRKLYEISSVNCSNTIFIENKDELLPEKIESDRIKKIGITAGASTPDWVIDGVIEKIKLITPVKMQV